MCVRLHSRRALCFSLVFSGLSVGLLLWTYTWDTWDPLPPTPARAPESPAVVPSLCGPGRVVWQKPSPCLLPVNGTKTLVLSAFVDSRSSRLEVRVIAVVLRKESVEYLCHVCCPELVHVSPASVHIHSDHFGFEYGTAHIMCLLPPGCEGPSHMALTLAVKNSTGLQGDHGAVFFEVHHQRPEAQSFSYNFTVCLSTMFEFTNLLQLVQSLEMLQLLGVNRVVVYKSSCSPEVTHLLDFYSQRGFVEVIPWTLSKFIKVSRGWLPVHGPGQIHYFGQIPALHDCLYRYMYRSKYVALHDMDELILPQPVFSWSALLPLLEMTYGRDECYRFESYVFPNTITLAPPPPTFETQRWARVPGVNILEHLLYEPNPPSAFNDFKIIVNPRLVFSPTVHGLLDRECVQVNRHIARLHHTRAPKQTELPPDQLLYDGRLLNYSALLSLAVSAALEEAGLLPEESLL